MNNLILLSNFTHSVVRKGGQVPLTNTENVFLKCQTVNANQIYLPVTRILQVAK